MNLIELMKRFPTDDRCRELLERLRWPNGPECPRCHGKKLARLNAKLLYCAACNYQFGVTVDTVFKDSHLSLITWFAVTLLLCEAKKGISACQIQRTLGISYKTAWYLCHRIRSAMTEGNRKLLDGVIEMDETYVGGYRRGAVGRSSENKEIVIAIRQRGGELRFFHAEDVKAGTLAKYIRENIREDVSVIMTDDFSSYPFAMDRAGIDRGKHKVIRHKTGVYVVGEIHTNTAENAFSLLKRGVMGTWHKISAKHLSAYLQEMEFRFNRRRNPNLFVETLRHMITSPALPFAKLTQKPEKAA